MNLSDDNKILVDGYIDEVCVNLPRKKRTDIAVEIRSLILDSLEARCQDLEVDPGEEMVLSVLQEFGSPIEMAGNYHPHNYVIGPRLYVPFWMTVRGVLVFMGFFYVLAFFFSWGEATQSFIAFLDSVWGLALDFFEDALRNLSIIFLIFVVLDRVIPDQDWITQLKVWGSISNIPFLRDLFGRTAAGEWDPTTLATSPKSEPVKRGETIFGMVIIILVAVLFNFFPHKVGVYGVIVEGETWFAPLLAPTFEIYLPWWNLYWLLALGLNFILLVRGRWNITLKWMDLILMVFSGFLVYWMLVGPPVIGLTPEYLALNQTSAEAVRMAEETIIPIITTILDVVFVLHLVIKVPYVFIKLMQLLGKPPILAWKPIDSQTENRS
jgi:hypothetical protein